MSRHAVVLAISTALAVVAGQAAIKLAGTQASARATTPAASSARSATVERNPDGHYWAQVEVGGRAVPMLVDTGASSVALTSADAARLGYDVAALRFDEPLTTAQGGTRAAAITLDEVRVGSVRVERVRALVVRRGLPASLLGMSYLGRLARFDATPSALVLTR